MRTLSNVIVIQNSRQVYFAFIQPKIVGGTKCLGNLYDAIKDLLLQKKFVRLVTKSPFSDLRM